jgi:hypothetical protein
VILDNAYTEGSIWPWFRSYSVIKLEAARDLLRVGFGMSEETVEEHMRRGRIAIPFKDGVKIGLVEESNL